MTYYLGHNYIRYLLQNRFNLFNEETTPFYIRVNLNCFDQIYPIKKFNMIIGDFPSFFDFINSFNRNTKYIESVLYISDRIFFYSLYLLKLLSKIIKHDVLNLLSNHEYESIGEELQDIWRNVPTLELMIKIKNTSILSEFSFLFKFTNKLTEITNTIKNHDSSKSFPSILESLQNFILTVNQLKEQFTFFYEKKFE